MYSTEKKFFPVECSCHFCQKSVCYRLLISGLSVLFHWSVYLSLRYSYTVWIAVVVSKFWNWEVWVLQFCLSFNIVWLCGHSAVLCKFKTQLCIFAKRIIGLFQSKRGGSANSSLDQLYSWLFILLGDTVYDIDFIISFSGYSLLCIEIQ